MTSQAKSNVELFREAVIEQEAEEMKIEIERLKKESAEKAARLRNRKLHVPVNMDYVVNVPFSVLKNI